MRRSAPACVPWSKLKIVQLLLQAVTFPHMANGASKQAPTWCWMYKTPAKYFENSAYFTLASVAEIALYLKGCTVPTSGTAHAASCVKAALLVTISTLYREKSVPKFKSHLKRSLNILFTIVKLYYIILKMFMFFFTILKLDKSAIILISNVIYQFRSFFNASITSRRRKPVAQIVVTLRYNLPCCAILYISDVIHTMYFNTF